LLGTIIDQRYETLEVLGEGGMGTVYRVRHTALRRQFALKALRRDLARDKDLSARFIQEAKTAAAIPHPNIVQITDFGSLPTGEPYFVMELLEGRSLRWLIGKGGSIPASRAVRILRQVAEALGAAHGAGVIHRDLKPDNIHVGDTVGKRELVKVLDFGLAKVLGGSKLTSAGMVFGTPHYMSPEQAAGEHIDYRSDIYALGVVMYEMFTGRVPFEADTYMGVLTKHMYVRPIPPSEIVGKNRNLGALEEITLRCLEKKPKQRYASMADLLDRLDEIVHFTESGDLEVKASAQSEGRVASVLADDLEAPTTEELSVMMRRAGLPRRRSVQRNVVLAGAAALLVIGMVWLGATLQPAAKAPGASAPLSSEAAQAKRNDSRVPALSSQRATILVVPASSGTLDPAGPQTDAAIVTSSQTKSGQSGSVKPDAAPRKAVSRPQPTTPPHGPRDGRKRPATGSSDIVDPWGR
jgi:serine/threonine-protein kinase